MSDEIVFDGWKARYQGPDVVTSVRADGRMRIAVMYNENTAMSDTEWANKRIDEILDADALALVLGDCRERLVQTILEAMARGWLMRGRYE